MDESQQPSRSEAPQQADPIKEELIENLEDQDDRGDDGGDESDQDASWYRPDRLIEPPEFDDQARQANEEILDDLRNAVGTLYQPPLQVFDMAINFDARRQRDPRCNALRSDAPKREKRRFVWAKEQDQLVVAFAIKALNDGKDLFKVSTYETMMNNPLLNYIRDPAVIRTHLQKMCHEDNTRDLEDLCGFNSANNDRERDSIRNVAKTIRAGCLDAFLVDKWNLRPFVRTSAHAPRRRRCFSNTPRPLTGNAIVVAHGNEGPEAPKRSRRDAEPLSTFVSQTTTTMTTTTMRKMTMDKSNNPRRVSATRTTKSHGQITIDLSD